MDADRKEIFRYLGYGRAEPDEKMKDFVEDCVKELEQAVCTKYLSRTYPLKLLPDHEVDGGCFHVKSRHLSRSLKDCDQVIVFAATLGTGADHLIQRYNKIQVSRAVVLQAASAAMIEDYCNRICTSMKTALEQEKQYLRPRFSPGYGDFPLECQPNLLDALEAGKRIGIKLTDSYLMMPSKSVTAVMGISQKPGSCQVKGCEGCEATDCSYRRES
ncbi:MAG: Vitamin B12 dependent methionine synthase activation subunit [Lachnospiraceae bacterium]|jgi:hypothetical protein|nr:Vitamin B12 dependent methionine synthase activation subunit [Lachnospiraceae bacterium]